jgi:hypothetical protein
MPPRALPSSPPPSSAIRPLAAGAGLALLGALALAACSSSSGGERASPDGGDASQAPDEAGTDATPDGTTGDAPTGGPDATPGDAAQLDASASDAPDASPADASPADSGPPDALADAPPTDATATATDSGPGDATSASDATPPDAALDAPADAPADAGADAPIDAGCTSTMAVLGGSATTIFSTTFASGQWAAPAAIGASGFSGPALVATGGQWLGVAQGPASALESTSFATGASSAMALVGAALTKGPPALVGNGASGRVVYWGTDFKFYDGLYTAGAWNGAGDPVGGAAAQAFGNSGPTAALVGGELVVAQCGTDAAAHLTSLIGGTWGPSVVVSGASVDPTVSPTLVALSGGSAELLLVAPAQTTQQLYYATRTGGTWSALQPVGGSTVFSPSAVSLAALGGGQAALVYEGSDSRPYVTLYDPASTPAWSSVAALVTGTNPALSSPPVGGAWSAPATLAGTSGATFATVATSP